MSLNAILTALDAPSGSCAPRDPVVIDPCVSISDNECQEVGDMSAAQKLTAKHYVSNRVFAGARKLDPTKAKAATDALKAVLASAQKRRAKAASA